MAKAKQQHYTPSVYLRGFASEGRVYCRRLENEHEWWAKPETIAKEKGFYGIDEGDSLENRLREEVESPFGPVRDKLLETADITNLSEKKREVILNFLAFQLERTSRKRQIVFEKILRHINSYEFGKLADEKRELARRNAESADIIVKAGMRAAISKLEEEGKRLSPAQLAELEAGLPKAIERFREDNLKRAETGYWSQEILEKLSQLDTLKRLNKNSHIANIPSLAETRISLLEQKRWILLRNNSNEPFITSDNPATIHQEPSGENSEPVSRLAEMIGGGRWDKKSDHLISVALPLSPRLLLMLSPNVDQAEVPYFKNTSAPEECIRYFNRATGMQAHRSLVSATESFGSAIEGSEVGRWIKKKLDDILPGLRSKDESEREKSRSALEELYLMLKASGTKL